jgi:hypothetical protein
MNAAGETIRDFGRTITIQTDRLFLVLTLGLFRRDVVVHADRRMVEVRERLLWRTTTRTVPFASIDRVVRIDEAVSILSGAGERIHITAFLAVDGARRFAARLDELIGASRRRRARCSSRRIDPPRTCDDCRRPAPPRRLRCLYCGGEVRFRHGEVVRGIPIDPSRDRARI